MTLDPDDLPEDPFSETGYSQVVCACTNDRLHVAFTPDGTVYAVCPECPMAAVPGTQRVVRKWVTGTMAESRGSPPPSFGRDTLQPEVHTGWYPDIPLPRSEAVPDPRLPQPVQAELHGQGKPPPLPTYSDGICNSYLDGGPYDGQLTWIMNDHEPEFRVIGVAGVYVPTDQMRSGRRVFTWHG